MELSTHQEEPSDELTITLKYLNVIKTKIPNPVLPAARAAQDLEGYV